MEHKQDRRSGTIWLLIVAAAVWGALFFAMTRPADAAGLLIADGGLGGVLEIEEHTVDVTVNNGIAVTTVTQVFRNTENRQVEALYTFPVPKGASVSNFSMWIKGKEMVGEVLEKKRAREIYNSYKARRRDPGLLEQNDYKTFEMRIFPIAAKAQQKVQITYYQELEFDNDTAAYVYPLSTVSKSGVDARVKGKFGLNVELKSMVPIASVKSPSHGGEFVVVQHSEDYAQASLETQGGSLGRDVVLLFTLNRPHTGVDLVASSRPGEDGYFLMTITAGDELKRFDTGMDYVFVLDVSGSMQNDRKLVISRDSLAAFIKELGPDDRFEVMTFNVAPRTLFGALTKVDDTSKAQANEFLDSQEARGGTNLVPAMTTAYKYASSDRTLNVIVLSDGMTEQSERSTLLRMIQSRPAGSRVFCIGIGNEVNRPLLEQLAQDSGGLAAFVSRGDDFTRQARAFRRKLMRPAASDIRLDFGGIRVYDVEPAIVPNLYHGAPVRVYGRYRAGGEATVRINATVMGREFEKDVPLMFPGRDDDNPEIERMWAMKRVDSLLKEADRVGDREPVIDEIVRLGEGYSIVTEYTSFLVLENDMEYKRWNIERKNKLRTGRDREAQARRDADLEAIRNRALSDLGPGALSEPVANNAAAKPVQVSRSVPQRQPQHRNQNRTVSPPSRSHDFSLGGSGPVGPLFIGGAWLLRRLRRRKEK